MNTNSQLYTTQPSFNTLNLNESKVKNDKAMQAHHDMTNDVVFNEILGMNIVQRSISNTPAMMLTRPNSGIQQKNNLQMAMSKNTFKRSPNELSPQEFLSKTPTAKTEFNQQFKFFKKMKERNASV